jgi:hypothetical protein
MQWVWEREVDVNQNGEVRGVLSLDYSHKLTCELETCLQSMIMRQVLVVIVPHRPITRCVYFHVAMCLGGGYVIREGVSMVLHNTNRKLHV